MQPFKINDLVTPKDPMDPRFGQGYKVTKVNPVNVKCSPLATYTGARGLNYPATALMAFDPDNPPKRPSATVPLPLMEGTIVTLAKPYRHVTTDDVYVVTKDNARTVSVAPLGRTDIPALRVPQAGLVKRDLTWLARHLTTTLGDLGAAVND